MNDRKSKPEAETAPAVDEIDNTGPHPTGDPIDADASAEADSEWLQVQFRMRRDLIAESARVIRALGQVLAQIPEMGGELTDLRVQVGKQVLRLAKRAEKLMFTVED